MVRPAAIVLLIISLVAGAVIACGDGRILPNVPRAANGVLDLRDRDFRTQKPVKLYGDWEFYWGEFIAPDRFAGKSPPETRLITIPSIWNGFEWRGRKLPAYGFATYRLRVLAPGGMRPALRLMGAATSFRVYVNGRLTAVNGKIAADKAQARPEFLPLVATLPAAEKDRPLDIVVHVSNYHHRRGGLWSAPIFGTSRQLHTERERSIALDIFLAGTTIIMALYHLAFFVLRRRNPGTVYFGLLCLTIALRALVTGERFLIQNFPEFPWEALLKLEYLTFFIGPALFGLYLRGIFPDESPKSSTWSVFALGIIASIITLVTPAALNSRIVPIWQIICLVATLFWIVTVIRAIALRKPDAGLLLFGALVFLAAFVNDLLFNHFLAPVGGLSPYGIIILIFSQAILLTRRFSAAFSRVEKLSGELEEQRKDLVRLDKLKDEFLSNTSHELRTPLQGIIGMADSLREQASSTTERRRLDLIMASGRRLSGLVNDILDFSKLRHRDLELRRKPFDLRAFTDLQLELAAFGGAREKNLLLVNAVPPELPEVLGDEERVAQILQNLLSNAVKYTDQGEIRVAAEINSRGLIEIAVSDTGTGIPAEDRERIFQPFEQGPGGYERKRGGTGLGLSIARSLAELHGGELRLDTRSGPGAVFRFTLPRSQSEERTVREDIHAPLPTPALRPRTDISSAPEALFSPPGKTIHDARQPAVLIVDDEPVLLEVMRTYLEQADIRVFTAENAEGMFASMEANGPPQCLVLDIMMPGMSGLEAARELRKQYSLLDLPILMVTAKTRTVDLMAALEAGANDYLTKPFEKETFLSRVGTLVSLSQSRRDARESRLAARDAARKEREKINADLHDHLGASLLDLKLMSEAALDNPRVDSNFARKLTDKLYATMIMLRSDLIHIEDLGLLEEDFISGMHMILLRRYMEAGREIDFRGPPESELLHANGFDDGHVGPLYAVIQEIATNDLKYGIGTPTYSFAYEGGDLRIVFESKSRYRLERHGTGQGTQGMIRRLAEIGGNIRMSLEPADDKSELDESIRIEIELPRPALPRAG